MAETTVMAETTTPEVVETTTPEVAETTTTKEQTNLTNQFNKPLLKNKSFKKPSLQQVIDYKNQLISEGQECTSDIQSFIDYHISGGWVVGKSPMKCWQAAFRTWERNHQKWSKQNANKQSATERRSDYASNLYDYEKATNF
jgi:hypothetical protein